MIGAEGQVGQKVVGHQPVGRWNGTVRRLSDQAQVDVDLVDEK
jgi:hypothetical protein